MMKATKRFMSLVLAGCLALSALPALAADAAVDTTGDAGAVVGEETALQSEDTLKAEAQAAKSYYCTKMTEYYSNGNIRREITYNEDGNLLSNTYYDSDSSVDFSYQYVYDENGNQKCYNSDGTLVSESEYDANGNLVKTTQYVESSGSTQSYVSYEATYDENNNLTRSKRYVIDGSLTYWTVVEYTYDERGNSIKTTNYSNYGDEDHLQGWREYAYDANDNVIKETEYDYDGTVEYWCEYAYDANGHMTKESLYRNDALTFWYEYVYDANGNETKETAYTSDGSVSSCYEYTYDANNNKIKEVYYKNDSMSYERNYEYDANGNLIKTTTGYSDGTSFVSYEAAYDENGNQTLSKTYTWNNLVDVIPHAEVSIWYTYEYAVLSSDSTEPTTITNPFTDVTTDNWFYDSVLWAVNKGITLGTSDTTFSPDDGCTRAQIVTFLWRSAGSPAPTTSDNPFTDVSADDWYYNAVLWAVENGITAGTSATTFSPNDTCLRSQAMTFIWRANSKPAAGSDNPFTDIASGEWYTDAVLWAVANNITLGTSATTFGPNDTCTRGQIVTFLYRAAE